MTTVRESGWPARAVEPASAITTTAAIRIELDMSPSEKRSKMPYQGALGGFQCHRVGWGGRQRTGSVRAYLASFFRTGSYYPPKNFLIEAKSPFGGSPSACCLPCRWGR